LPPLQPLKLKRGVKRKADNTIPGTTYDYNNRIVQPNDIENTAQENFISNCTTQLALYSQTTVEVEVHDCRGNVYTTRALLDSVSQSNFITESLANKLNLPVRDSNVIISGIIFEVKQSTAIKISSRNSRYNSLLPSLT